ncbi:MAG: PAS domain-containing protein [Methanoculleus sp.]|uniref:PAS domain-containing protein n=2 Tax=Methanoculleus TaxID=45989 RepID=UPI0025E762FA|nr:MULTISPECIES: PAS domain-containing protein [unclassified Methanoculleus]MCK9317493.1 PAS domain-containing protein [Methanoculleus sp.]MDD2252955.1 PAS domain-containing protein [Methanoculleus sp.]MDD3215930.1 PAS domain-containing protein [Methanoculleus sp.]MDD4313680.1 PAS domain-containing protein [Methanoculleus sp.]MDD4470151.1 PAS domain-containing protein [Methanoculleus sp.]
MQPEQDIARRALRTLKFRPKGMTITEIARALGVNRNSVSKHLEVMQAEGHVEARLVGNAKVYAVAQRVPLSAFLCFTKNLILVLDADLTIVQANDQCLRRFGRTKDEIIGQNIHETALPVVSTPEVLTVVENVDREQVITDICHRRDDGSKAFYQMQAIPTTFESGEKGCTIVLEDITERKRYTRNMAFLARTAIDLVDLQPVEDIYGYTVGRMLELVPGAYAYIFSYNEAEHRFAIRAVTGEGFREGVTELLGRDPTGLVLPVVRIFEAPYHQTPLSMRGLQEFILRPEPSSWSFYDLCFRAIPEEICEAILERFDIERLCCTGLVWRDHLYGIAGFLLPPGREVESRETVESFLRQVSIAIARRETAEHLRLSEARFRGMLDSSPFGVALIDHDRRFVYINRRFVEIFGSEPEITTTAAEWVRQIFPDDAYRQEAIDAWHTDLERSVPGQVRPRTFTIRDRNGAKKTVLSRAVTLCDGTEYVTCEDITEEARAYRLLVADIADLRRREQQMLLKDRAIACTRRAVALLDPDGVVTYANAAYLALWGYPTAEGVQGSDFSRFWEKPEEIRKIIRTVIEGGSWHGEEIGVRNNGEKFQVDLLGTPIVSENGRVLGMMAAATARRAGA